MGPLGGAGFQEIAKKKGYLSFNMKEFHKNSLFHCSSEKSKKEKTHLIYEVRINQRLHNVISLVPAVLLCEMKIIL